MKLLLIILLFSLNLFAQEVITVGKGSGSYLYDCVTGTDLMVNGDLYLYGHYTKTPNDTGAYSFKRYIVWKYTGGTYDSTSADNVLFMAGTWAVRVNDPTLDATGTYYSSILYRTQRGKGVWIYDRGGDSTFTTPVTIVPPDTVPVQFAFHDSTGAEYSTLVESNGITLLGLDSCWAYAGGASFKVNAGAWRTTSVKVFENDVLYLRATSSAVCTTAVNTTLIVGGVSDVFSITTKLDNTPSAFTFTDKTGAEVSTLYTSNQFTLAGINCNAAISINGGQFQINAAAWRSSSTTVANGSLVRVRNTSSANYNTSVTSILTIGGVQDTYTITTRADTTPVQFTFTDVTNAHLDSLHTSNGVALTSLDSCNGSAGLDTFKVGILGSWFVGMKKVYGGDTIYLKNVSSGSYSTAESMTFSAGGTSDTWSITTIPDPNYTGTIRYVDNRVTSSGNGQSWATAWKNLSNVVWSQLSGGGYLYISGGVDSVQYNETLTPQCRGTKNSLIHIFAGRNSPSPSGHSGRVIIDMQSENGSNAIFINEYGGRSPAYLHIKGFELQWMTFGIHVDDDMSRSGGMNARGIIFDSLKITKFLGTTNVIPAVGIWGESDSMIVQNCYIKTLDTPGQTDIMHYNGNNNGSGMPRFNIIRNNFLDNTNQDPLAHNDAIQGVDGEGYWIYNNIIINDSVYSPEGGGVPFIVTSNDWDNDNWPPNIWFNNFAYMGGAWMPGASPGFAMWNRHDGGAGGNKSSGSFIFNNTIVSNGPNMGIFENQFHYDLFVNNICALFCQSAYRGEWKTPFGILMNIDGGNQYLDSTRYNLIWKQDSLTSTIWGYNTESGFKLDNESLVKPVSWANWTSYSGTGLFRNPNFVNNFGYEPDQSVLKPDIKSNSPAIDAGEDLTWLQNYFTSIGIPSDVVDAMDEDIYGNPRNDWDIGAVEYGAGGWTPPDTTATITINSVTGAELNSYHIGSGVLSGADSTFHIWTVTADSFRVTGGTFNTTMVSAVSGNTLYIPVVASDQYSTSVTNYVVVSGTTRSFTVTTKADPYVPPSGNSGAAYGSDGK